MNEANPEMIRAVMRELGRRKKNYERRGYRPARSGWQKKASKPDASKKLHTNIERIGFVCVYLNGTDKTMNTLTTARTFQEVISDWEHGLEPYKGESFLPRASLSPADDSPHCDRRSQLAEMIRSFFSLKVRSTFLLKVVAVAVFWYFFACLPPLNTGPEDPRGYYVHNFLTDTVEYKLAERNIVK